MSGSTLSIFVTVTVDLNQLREKNTATNNTNQQQHATAINKLSYLTFNPVVQHTLHHIHLHRVQCITGSDLLLLIVSRKDYIRGRGQGDGFQETKKPSGGCVREAYWRHGVPSRICV